MALDSTVFETILILLIYEHEIFFHLFVSTSVSFINVIVFSVQVFHLLGLRSWELLMTANWAPRLSGPAGWAPCSHGASGWAL